MVQPPDRCQPHGEIGSFMAYIMALAVVIITILGAENYWKVSLCIGLWFFMALATTRQLTPLRKTIEPYSLWPPIGITSEFHYIHNTTHPRVDAYIGPVDDTNGCSSSCESASYLSASFEKAMLSPACQEMKRNFGSGKVKGIHSSRRNNSYIFENAYMQLVHRILAIKIDSEI